MLVRLSAWTAKNVRWLFAAALAVVCVAHLSTVTTYPAPWLDEVQLIENGRCVLFEPSTPWALIFRSVSGESCELGVSPTYLSGAVAEAFDRTCGVWWMHRVFSLLGLLAATGLCLQWLRRKGFALPVACGVALLFCTDVHLTKSAHFYRPDAWALAMIFATALVLDRMDKCPARFPSATFFGLGFAMAFQVIFWFSSLFGLTLIVAEFFVLALRQAWDWRKMLKNITSIVAGGITGILALVVLPFSHELRIFILYLFTHPDVQSLQTECVTKLSWICALSEHFRDFARLLVLTPFLWSLAVAGLLLGGGRCRMLGGTFVGCMLVLLLTHTYCFRMVYFLPLAAYFAAVAWSEAVGRLEKSPFLRVAFVLFIGASLMFGLGLNVIGLNVVATSSPNGSARAALKQDLVSVVGRGPRAVCLFSWQPYFIGRELGWKMFATMPFDNKMVFRPDSTKFLGSLDFVLEQEFGAGVIEDNGRALLSDEERGQLRNAGFVPVGRAGVAAAEQAAVNSTSVASRLRNCVWASEYPSYTIWQNAHRTALR